MTLRMIRTLFANDSAWRWRELTEADLEVEPELIPEMGMGASVPPARAVAARA